MTTRIGNTIIIEKEDPEPCELCGTIAELRPYGPDGKKICFDCGMKDEEGTFRRMNNILFNDPKEIN